MDDSDDIDDGREEDENENVRPTLTAPAKVSVHAGQQLTLAVTAFDCADRPIVIKASGLPKGATIVNSVDPILHLPKAVITWTPSANLADEDYKIILTAVATDSSTHKTLQSSPKKVVIDVLPAVQDPMDDLDSVVKRNVVGSARYNAKSKKLEVSGQVVWDRAGTVAERKAVIAKEKTAVITDAATGTRLGKAPVDKNGRWKASIATGKASVPRSIDATFHGKTGVKAVSGVKKSHH